MKMAWFRQPSGSEGRLLRGPVPADFEAFYRAMLRYRTGLRVRSSDLAQRYAEWAAEQHGSSLNLREIKQAMASIGHRALKSNGIWYLDVGFADALPGVADNFPLVIATGSDVAGLVERLDAVMAELVAIRAKVAA